MPERFLPLAERLPHVTTHRLGIDVGGSTIRFALCDESGTQSYEHRIVRPYERFPDLETCIAGYLVEVVGFAPEIAIIGAAGPVGHDDSFRLTNSPWPAFVPRHAKKSLGITFFCVNDMTAAAASIAGLGPGDIEIMHAGQPEFGNSKRMIITQSTGVNAATAVHLKVGSYVYIAGETGHMAFTPRTEDEVDLLRFGWDRINTHVSYEDFMSGSRGFRNIFEYVTTVLGITPKESTVEQLSTPDALVSSAPMIAQAALTKDDPAALRTLEILGGVMGSYWQSVALSTLPTSGLYLMGGVTENSALMQFLFDQTELLARFHANERYSELLKRIPIYRVLRGEIGVLGACQIAYSPLLPVAN